MIKPTCRECLHCRVKSDPIGNDPSGQLAFCSMDAWPARNQTQAITALLEKGTSWPAEFADGCVHFEDMTN